MKRGTHEVAREFGLHPANFLLYLAEMRVQFDEAWPTIDDAWIETFRAQDWNKWGNKPKGVDLKESEEVISVESQRTPLSVDPDSLLIVEKLWRKNKWGSVCVTFEALQNLTHLASDKLQSAVHRLREGEILLTEGARGPYSLNPARKGDIEHIAAFILGKGSPPKGT
jgi:hypothetical protein